MIREMTAEDESSAIRKLLALATSYSKTARELQDYLQKPQRVLYVAEKDGTAVGCIGIELEAEGQCEIRHIAVSPDMRGRQIGSKMIVGIQQKHELQQIHAETDHDAIGFYRSCGFDIRSLGEKYPGVERFYCVKTLTE